MKKLLILLAVGFLLSCTSTKNDDFSVPKKVVVAGRVVNIDPGNLDVELYVNRLGLGQKVVYTQADSSGRFCASFETYTPTDVLVMYKTNFFVLVQPGDSIYVEFDGKTQQRSKLLKTIKFGGKTAKANQDAAGFQQMYFSNPLYYDWDAKEKAKQTYDVDQYLLYLDTLQQRIDELYTQFLAEVNPDTTVRIWAKTYIEQDYYDALSWYPGDHLRANSAKQGKWSVPDNYFDALLKRLPIEKSQFISGYALSNFINRFHYHYSGDKIWNEAPNQQYKFPGGYGGPTEIIDSLEIYGILKYTPDSLLRQMVLTEYFRKKFDKSEIRVFEKYKEIAEEFIVEPFLWEPLFALYSEVKDRIEHPVPATDAYLEKLENTTAKQLIDSVLSSNKGKVIYLDCWATWCAPCKAEMPNSKRLMEELKDKEVAFVFLCIDSEEALWKATLAELQLGGQHFFLTSAQSADFRKVFDIQGIPFYFLIDQKGTIIEKGSQLRPNNVKEKILEML